MRLFSLMLLTIFSMTALAQSKNITREEKIFYVNFKSKALAKQVQQKFDDPEEPALKDVAVLVENAFSRDDLVITQADAISCLKKAMNKNAEESLTSYKVLVEGLASACLVDHLYSLDIYSNWK